MEIRNLRTFLQVAALGNFTQAGRVLGYSQSNVSAQIQQMEKDLGVQLFDRIGRGVSLTQYGELLLPYARQMVELSAEIDSFLRPEQELRGTVRIGVVESLFDACFEPFVLRYARRFPNVHLEVTVDGTAALQELLRKNQLDVACLIGDPLPKTDWQCAYDRETEIALVAAAGHQLAGRRIRLEDLANERLVLMEETAPYSLHFHRVSAAGGVALRPFLTLQSTGMARRLVEHGGCVSLLPVYTVKDAVADGSLTLLDLPEVEQRQTIQMILHRNKAMTPQIRGVLDEMTAAMEERL